MVSCKIGEKIFNFCYKGIVKKKSPYLMGKSPKNLANKLNKVFLKIKSLKKKKATSICNLQLS